jgi:hypothetical protein
MKRLLLVAIAVCGFVLTASGQTLAHLPKRLPTPPNPTRPVSPMPVTAASTGYALVAWTELGMHCIDGNDYSVFSVLPPYNVIHAQLVQKTEPPVLITSGITITYQSTADSKGSINTSSSGKTNFWTYVRTLFLNSVPPETGLAGYKTQSHTPQPLTYNSIEGYWEAVGIPTVPTDDKSKFNPFPMVKLVAKDTAGHVLATASIVLSVSDEMSCATCHASNSDKNAMPSSGWVNNPDPAKDTKLNILKKHDDRWPISQYLSQLEANGWSYQPSLYQTANSGTAVLCAACHSDNALGLPGIPGVGPLTTDMHTLHGSQILLATGTTLDVNSKTSDLNSCYLCHPGPVTLCKRGAMNTQLCSACHGNLTKVGDPTRTGWLDVPSCQMCHNSGLRYTSTFTSKGQWRQTKDLTFATNPDVPQPGKDLFRYSAGHGAVFCSACHGSPHAEYPSLQANDNVYPTGLQGYVAKVTECGVCHGSLPVSATGGPHGIHTLGQTWVNESGHQNYVDRYGYQACAYCHGVRFNGSALSQSKIQRTFTVEDGNVKTFPALHQFTCYDCHNGPNGG